MATKKSPRLQKSNNKEGWEDFSLKTKWFLKYRDPGGGRTLKEVYDEALHQVRRMDTYVSETPPLPGKALKKPQLGLFQNIKATVTSTKNPSPGSAIGFASEAVKVSGDKKIPQSILYLPLSARLKSSVDENTICVFRHVEISDSWSKMPECGLDPAGTFAWARIHEPGVYIAIGLPSDHKTQASLLTLYLNRDKLSVASTKKERLSVARQVLKGAGRLAAFLSGKVEQDLAKFDIDQFGFSPIPGGNIMQLGFGGFPNDLPLPGGLPLPGFKFAEWDILDDICPPWFGGKWPYLPGRWPRLPLPWPLLPFPWPFPWDWKMIGPKNINGRIASLCIHPSNSNILYAGAANGGVWKTLNGGLNWSYQWITEDSMAVGGIAICQNFPNTLYAATGEDTPGWGPSYPGVGIYKTTDGGSIWNKCTGTGVGDRCMKVIVHPTDPNTVYVASNSGFFKTTDGGSTPWTLIHTGHCTDAVIDPFNPNIIYLAIWNDGIYKTVDGGTTWNPANGGFQWRIVGSRLVQIWRGIPTGGSAEWISLAIGKNGTGGSNFLIAKLGLNSGDVYKTTNGGSTWFRVASPVQPVTYNEWTNICAINPNNHNILFAGGVGLSRSINGSTFTPTSGTHSDHQQLVFDPFDPNICYVATDGGVYKSTNGGQNWTLQSTNLQATQLLSFGISQAGGYRIGGATQDQGIIQSNGTTNWIDNGGGNEWGIFVVDPNNSQNIYISPGGGLLRQSINGGGSWATLTNGLTDVVNGTTTPAATTIDIAVKSGNSNVLLFAGTISDPSQSPAYFAIRIWRSTNKGVSFTGVFNMTDSPTKVLFAPSDGNIVYLSCSNGNVYRNNNGGQSGSWSLPYAIVDRPVFSYISCMAIDWTDPNRIYIGYGGFGATRIMRSIDGGAHWTNISGSIPATALPLIPLNAIALDQYDQNKIYIGTDIGVFRTRDGGLTWENYNNGFFISDHPRIIVTGLHLRRSDNALYSGTMGRGAYRKYL